MMAGALGEIQSFIKSLKDEGFGLLAEQHNRTAELKARGDAVRYRTLLVSVLNMLADPHSVVTRAGGLTEDEEALVMKAWLAVGDGIDG